jgi:hypothetical protein
MSVYLSIVNYINRYCFLQNCEMYGNEQSDTMGLAIKVAQI